MIYPSSDLFDLSSKELAEARLVRVGFLPGDCGGDVAAGCDVGVPELKQSGSTSRAAHEVLIQREERRRSRIICLSAN